MTLDEARKRLFDTTFLLGGLRRRAAIKALAASPGEAGVLALVAALGQNHPSPQEILHALVRLSPEAEADKVEALWTALVSHPKPALAGVLARLGRPRARVVPAKTARDVLSVAVEGTGPEILQAIAVFARALPVGDEAGNDAIFAAWVRSQSAELERLIAEQGRQPATPPWRPCTPWSPAGWSATPPSRTRTAPAWCRPSLWPLNLLCAPSAERRRQPGPGDQQGLPPCPVERCGGPGPGVENLKLVGDEDGLFEQTRALRLLDVLDLCQR